jgi:hypothetical protein
MEMEYYLRKREEARWCPGINCGLVAELKYPKEYPAIDVLCF